MSEEGSRGDNRPSKKSLVSTVAGIWNNLSFWAKGPALFLGVVALIAVAIFMKAAFNIPVTMTLILLLILIAVWPRYKENRTTTTDKATSVEKAPAQTTSSPVSRKFNEEDFRSFLEHPAALLKQRVEELNIPVENQIDWNQIASRALAIDVDDIESLPERAYRYALQHERYAITEEDLLFILDLY